MANPYRGEVALEGAGKPVTLRPSMTAIVAWEGKDGTDQSTLALAVAATRQSLKTTDLIAVVRAASAAGGTPLTDIEITNLIEEKGIWHFLLPVTELLNNALMGGAEGKAGEAGAPDQAPLQLLSAE